ncbi:MAG TPA: hypothetical protein VHX14_01625 [Thermoanaerobaculia bacterium]|jgi:hypothetical protein|nr:hypothetical protein [Thermoanaerobaculia bacterium]
MATIVGVHGINQQLKAAEVLYNEWWPSLHGGVTQAGRKLDARTTLACAFYGGLFREAGVLRAGGAERAYRGAIDVDDGFEKELLQMLWTEAARTEPERVFSPDDVVRGTPKAVQSALRAVSRSKFFVGVSEQMLIGSLKQVRSYMNDANVRSMAQEAVHKTVTEDTRVVVAHSLGSVVAYEALHRFADELNWANVRTLVTLGSPLGIRNLIFDRLFPSPEKGKGAWPKLLKRWTNVSDDGDIVALLKRLGDVFPDVVDYRIDNQSKAHDVSPYLTAATTGQAIADGL